MRNATIFILAAALAAAPAVAQNEVDANTAAANAAAANVIDPTNDANAVTNYIPVEPPTEITPPPTTTVVRDRGFPWGVIGLVGLIGLLGRRRRND